MNVYEELRRACNYSKRKWIFNDHTNMITLWENKLYKDTLMLYNYT